MFRLGKLSAAVISANAAMITSLAAVPANAAPQEIEEVIVTATKRAVPLQDAPVAIQAIGENSIQEQNIKSFVDYVKYIPNVNAGGRGPGQNEIYIRGAAVDAINITVAESQGSAPNVALYLDEQPVTAGGRNLDVYVADLERIEVLPGPQGTLYGASSMAGTVRLITNKPVIDELDVRFNGGISSTKNGEASNNFGLVLNVPLMDGKLAGRAALYRDSQGGYIDNVQGTFQADNTVNPTFPGDSVTYAAGTQFADGSVVGADGLTVPVSKAVGNNSALVEDDFNDATYQGARLGLKYIVNDSWDVLVQHTTQTLETEGVFDYDPTVGDLEVNRYSPDSLNDDFNQTAWTVNGRLGDLDLIYTGAFLDREVAANIDYTGYTNIGAFISGYQCEYLVGSYYNGLSDDTSTFYTWDPTIGGDTGVIECGTPVNAARIENENTRWTHEARVATNFEGPVNFQAGVFYENFEIKHIGYFNYQAPIDAGFAAIDINKSATFDESEANGRGRVIADTQFRNDNTRTEEQTAFFAEATYQVTDNVSLTAAARYYDLEYAYTGYGAWRYGNRPLFVDDADTSNDIRPDLTGGREYEKNFGELQPLNVSDTIYRFSASWTPEGTDTLLYVTWSEGYRPPGFNRAAAREGGVYDAAANNLRDDGSACGAKVAIDSNANTSFPGYCLPYVFKSDTLQNMELGWKTTLADGRVQLNGAAYRIDWKDIQVSQFDSQNISILTIVDNGGDAEISGIEGDLVWLASERLSIFAAGSFNQTELVYVDPAFAIVVADEGTMLPLTPEVQFNVRARYEFPFRGDLMAHWQLGYKYAGESVNSLVDTVDEPNTMQDAYSLVDASVGVENPGKGWRAEAYINNLTDERAQLHINRQDFFERVTTNRPRTMGVRVSYELN
jgi:outer membrane receptor protein involved in Fe transport